MKKKYSYLIKNVGLFTIGSFGSKLLSFLFLPLYTAVLSTEDYGSVDLLYSTISMLTPILLLSIQDATLRFSMDNNYEKRDVISTTFNIIFKGTTVLALANVILNYFDIIHFEIMHLIFFYFTFVVGAMNNCLSLYLKSKDKASVIAVSGILSTLVNCISNILFLLVFKLGINGYMLSNILALGVQFIYQLFIGKAYEDLRFKNYKNISKPMVKYSTPLIANSVSWWINNASDRYIISWLCGVGANGIYSISYKIPTILITFQSIFYNAWSISAISEFDEKDSDGFLGKNYTIYSLVSIVVCSVLLLMNIPLAKTLYSGEFYYAWKFIPFLLVATVFNGIAQFEGSLFAAARKTKEVSQTTVVGAVCNTVFNFIFIYLLGVVGAAFSTMIGYGVVWAMRTIFLNKFVKLKVQWNKQILSIILIITQSIIATLNYFYVAQIFIFFILICINFRDIKAIILKLIKIKK